jgi:hypothetical protein
METNAESHNQSEEEQGGTVMVKNLERRRRGRRRSGLKVRKMQADVRNLSTHSLKTPSVACLDGR